MITYAHAYKVLQHDIVDRRSGQPVRLLGVGVSGLQEGYRQLELWDIEQEHERRLQETLDELRDRFGAQAVRRGL